MNPQMMPAVPTAWSTLIWDESEDDREEGERNVQPLQRSTGGREFEDHDAIPPAPSPTAPRPDAAQLVRGRRTGDRLVVPRAARGWAVVVVVLSVGMGPGLGKEGRPGAIAWLPGQVAV